MAAEKTEITEEQVRQSLEALGVFVGDFDGTVYVKANNLERAMYGYGRGEKDNLVTLKDFTERLNNEEAPE